MGNSKYYSNSFTFHISSYIQNRIDEDTFSLKNIIGKISFSAKKDALFINLLVKEHILLYFLLILCCWSKNMELYIPDNIRNLPKNISFKKKVHTILLDILKTQDSYGDLNLIISEFKKQ